MERLAKRAADDLGTLLRELRARRGVSQARLAEGAGVNRVTVARWETGATAPRGRELEAALVALGASNEEGRVARRLSGGADGERGASLALEGAGVLQVSDARPPVGGDLLRSLRQRRGWTQARVAEVAGVTQATLNRWERGESWPAHDALHQLAHALGALPAEVCALTSGRFGLDSGVPPALREAVRAAWADSHAAYGLFAAHFHAADGTQVAALADLRLLSLIAWLWREAHAEPTGNARRLLAQSYGNRAHALALTGELANAEREATTALRLLEGDATRTATRLRASPLLTLAERDVYGNGVTFDARRAVALGPLVPPREGDPRRAREYRYRQGLKRAATVAATCSASGATPAEQAWALAHVARYHAGAGQWGEAVEAARRAVEVLPDLPEYSADLRLRRQLLARVSLGAGDVHGTLAVLSALESDGGPDWWELEESAVRAAALYRLRAVSEFDAERARAVSLSRRLPGVLAEDVERLREL